MDIRRHRQQLCLALIAGLASTWAVGCGPSKVPDGGSINATIPAEEAAKQNDAYKSYSKGSRKGQPPG